MKIWVKTTEWSEGKFLVVRRDGTTPDWPHFVMGARDPAVSEALRAYAAEGRRQGYAEEYCASIEGLALDFEHYRSEHGNGDPESPPHRTDNALAIAMMRRETSVAEAADELARLRSQLETTGQLFEKASKHVDYWVSEAARLKTKLARAAEALRPYVNHEPTQPGRNAFTLENQRRAAEALKELEK